MDKLECKLCGGMFSHLGSHVYHKHKMTAKEYKIMFGLNINTALISESVKKKKQIAFNKDREKYLANFTDSAKYQFKKGEQKRHYFSKESIKQATRELKKLKLKGRCFICGITFNHLPNHLRLKHKILLTNLNTTKIKSIK